MGVVALAVCRQEWGYVRFGLLHALQERQDGILPPQRYLEEARPVRDLVYFLAAINEHHHLGVGGFSIGV
jgi:hypothetical protein